jgi:hypothetical protein
MSAPTTLITEMAILVGIFLLGFLAKMFPRKTESRDQRSEPMVQFRGADRKTTDH